MREDTLSVTIGNSFKSPLHCSIKAWFYCEEWMDQKMT